MRRIRVNVAKRAAPVTGFEQDRRARQLILRVRERLCFVSGSCLALRSPVSHRRMSRFLSFPSHKRQRGIGRPFGHGAIVDGNIVHAEQRQDEGSATGSNCAATIGDQPSSGLARLGVACLPSLHLEEKASNVPNEPRASPKLCHRTQ